MMGDASHGSEAGENEAHPGDRMGPELVERVLQIEEEIASTHRVRWSIIVKVGVPAGLILFFLIWFAFSSPLTTVESLITATLVTLIGAPSVAIAVLLGRGRSDRKRLQRDLEALLSGPRPSGPSSTSFGRRFDSRDLPSRRDHD